MRRLGQRPPGFGDRRPLPLLPVKVKVLIGVLVAWWWAWYVATIACRPLEACLR